MKKSDWIILVFILIIALAIYLATLGRVDVFGENQEEESFEEKRKKALHRHRKLKDLISKKEELKMKLDKKFKIYYFLTRVGMVLIWLGFNAILYWVFNIKDFGSLLNYNEVVLLGTACVLFLRFGNLTNIQNIITYFKTKIENKVYKKYVSLPEKIEGHKQEIKIIESKIFDVDGRKD